MLNNFISQAGQTQLHGIPNDIMQNIDPITIIIFIPIVDRFLYPGLRKIGVEFKPITRITWGFLLGSGAMAYAAGVQKLIYSSGPCYQAPGAAKHDRGNINVDWPMLGRSSNMSTCIVQTEPSMSYMYHLRRRSDCLLYYNYNSLLTKDSRA